MTNSLQEVQKLILTQILHYRNLVQNLAILLQNLLDWIKK